MEVRDGVAFDIGDQVVDPAALMLGDAVVRFLPLDAVFALRAAHDHAPGSGARGPVIEAELSLVAEDLEAEAKGALPRLVESQRHFRGPRVVQSQFDAPQVVDEAAVEEDDAASADVLCGTQLGGLDDLPVPHCHQGLDLVFPELR